MAEEKLELRKINWREAFGWTELFRGFKIALDLKKLLLAGAGLALVWLGWLLLSYIWAMGPSERPVNPWATGPDVGVFGEADLTAPLGVIDKGFRGVIRPVTELAGTAIMVGAAPTNTVMFHNLCRLVWAVLVWALIGGAITRIAAVQVAREEKIGLLEAVKFAVRKYPSYLGAPIFPVLGIVFFVFCCVIAGLFARIPYVGAALPPLAWFLVLTAGIIMTIIVIGLVLAWPLMFTTISAEGSDSFDAISRSYSYLYQRPWRYGLYWLVAAVYGAIVLVFVFTFSFLMVDFSKKAVSLGLGVGNTDTLYRYAPTAPMYVPPAGRFVGDRSQPDPASVRLAQGGGATSDDSLPPDLNPAAPDDRNAPGQPTRGARTVPSTPTPLAPKLLNPSLRGPESSWRYALTHKARQDFVQWEQVGAYIIAFWVGLIWLLTVGFAFSYFWSASTLIYFLLRRDVDATEMEEVYIEEEEEEDFGFGEPETPGAEPPQEPPTEGEAGDATAEPEEPGPEAADKPEPEGEQDKPDDEGKDQ